MVAVAGTGVITGTDGATLTIGFPAGDSTNVVGDMYNGLNIVVNTDADAKDAVWDAGSKTLTLTVADLRSTTIQAALLTALDTDNGTTDNDGTLQLGDTIAADLGFTGQNAADFVTQGQNATVAFSPNGGAGTDDGTAFASGISTVIAGGVAAVDAYNLGAKTQSGTYTDNLGQVSTISVTENGAAAETSLLNGITFEFVDGTADGIIAGNETFSFKDGVITINLSAMSSNGQITATLRAAINAHEAAIKQFNGSAETRDFTGANAVGALNIAVTGSLVGGGTTDAAGTSFTLENGRGLGDVIEAQASTGTITFPVGGGNAPNPGVVPSIKLTTEDETSALNGISINFTTDSSQAGFDRASGALTVYLNPTTQAMGPGADLEHEINQAINGAINSNWDTIKQYTNSLDQKVPAVKVELDATTTVADLLTLTPTANETLLRFPPSDAALAGAPADAYRGISVNDPALIIEANSKGPEMAGVDIKFVYDSSMQPSTTEDAYVRTVYDEETKTLLIYANDSALRTGTDGGINAQVLANALNNEVGGDFRNYFTAKAPVWDDDPASSTSQAVVAFDNGILSSAKTVGGYAIQTEQNANNDVDTAYATSTGLAMTGNNDSSERIVLQATEAGSEHFVKVDVKQGSFDTYCPLGLRLNELAGTDVVATINGIQASGRGNNISINTNTLALSMDVTDGAVGSTNFNITGGGALFQLGPNVVSSQQMRVGLGSMLSTNLGGASGMLYQLKNGGEADITMGEHARVLADKIVNEAISFVANTRGRLGAVQKSSLAPNIAMLQDSLVALTEAEASYSNADFAVESSNLTRLQLLVQSGMTTLGIANQFPQYAAQLVRG